MKKWWWKILSILLLLYSIIAGLNVFNLSVFEVPRLRILHESIRNLYFHVCMWFSMMIIFTASVVIFAIWIWCWQKVKSGGLFFLSAIRYRPKCKTFPFLFTASTGDFYKIRLLVSSFKRGL